MVISSDEFEATNSVFNATDRNNSSYSSSVTTPERWILEGGEQDINKLNEILELRSQNDIELHVKEAEKTGTRIETENSGFNLEILIILKV